MHVGTQHFLSAFGEAEVEGLGAGGSDAAVTKGFPFLPGSRSAHVSLSPASFPGCQEAPDEPAEQSRAGEDPALCLRPNGPQGGPGGGAGGGWKQPRNMVPCPGWGSATSSPSCPSQIPLQIAGQAVVCPEKHFLSRGVQQLPQLSSFQDLTLYPKEALYIR